MNKSEDLHEVIAKVRKIEIVTDHNQTYTFKRAIPTGI